MQLQPASRSAAGRRRCTIGPPLPEREEVFNCIEMSAERVNPTPVLATAQQGGEGEGTSSSDLTEQIYATASQASGIDTQMDESQQLFLWSAAPEALGPPSAADSAGVDATQQPASSPSDALKHSLGDLGLRSAMRPPAFCSQEDWLRHLLLQAVEDAQLLFSSLWEECSCSTLGLPLKPCKDEQPAADSLDPAIAFAACAPSAPKRRLARGDGGSTAAPAADGVNATPSPITREVFPRPSTQVLSPSSAQHHAETTNSMAADSQTKDATRPPPAKPTAREYISAAMSWATKQLEDPRLFPSSPTALGSGAPEVNAESNNSEYSSLRAVASLMVRRLLRCYAHVYLRHLQLLQQHGAVGHANRCLKRLVFLAVDAQLLDGDEGPLQPIRPLADGWLRRSPAANPSGAKNQQDPMQQLDAAAAEPETADDWLLPALNKAEQCLGVLDAEEFPSFGAEASNS